MSAMALVKDEQPDQNPIEAGAVGGLWQGYDSVSGRGLATAVTGTFRAQGAYTRVTYTACTDLETLARTLEVSQSLSASYGSIASGDVKSKFVSNLNVTTYSLSIVVHARHVSGIEIMTDVALKQDTKVPKTKADRLEFFLKYGDSFVSSRTLGGEYIAVYTFYSRSKEQQDSLVFEMGAQGLWQNVKVDASLQTKIDNFTKSVQTRSTFDQIVTGIESPTLPDAANIIGFAIKFPSMPLDTPATIAFETVGYERVLGGFGDIPRNRSYFVGTGVVTGLTNSLVGVRQLQAQADWLRSIYQFYGYAGDTKLAAAIGDAKSDLAAINEQMQNWERDPEPAGGFPALKLKTANLGMPALNFTFHQTQPYGGGGGGNPFNDINTSSYLQLQTRIVSMQLRTGSVVDCLETTYLDAAGNKKVAKNGGDSGTFSAVLQLEAGEFISNVSGYGGDVLNKLEIKSTNGDTISGGGQFGGPPFSWTVPQDSVVLGFAGRAGGSRNSSNNILQLQVYYATFAPAKWSGG